MTNTRRAECAKIRAIPTDPTTMLRALPVYHARAVTNGDVLTLVTDIYGNRYAFVSSMQQPGAQS